MNPNHLTAQQSIAVAQRRLAQAQIPRGAPRGAMAGQAPAVQPQAQVPQGADAGAMAGCAPDGCASGYQESPFAGLPTANHSRVLKGSLLGVFVQPATAAATTLEISCGNTFFNGCGARSFGAVQGGENLITSIVSGFDTEDQLCPGSGIDVAFFQTTDCYCPFYFGCFSNLAPLLLTFDPIDTQSNLAPLNLIIVGDRISFDGCFPFPPGLMPQQVPTQGLQWAPPPAGGQLAAAMPPQANPQWGGMRGYGGMPGYGMR